MIIKYVEINIREVFEITHFHNRTCSSYNLRRCRFDTTIIIRLIDPSLHYTRYYDYIY